LARDVCRAVLEEDVGKGVTHALPIHILVPMPEGDHDQAHAQEAVKP
jgi:hypothetical protein